MLKLTWTSWSHSSSMIRDSYGLNRDSLKWKYEISVWWWRKLLMLSWIAYIERLITIYPLSAYISIQCRLLHWWYNTILDNLSYCIEKYVVSVLYHDFSKWFCIDIYIDILTCKLSLIFDFYINDIAWMKPGFSFFLISVLKWFTTIYQNVTAKF